MPLIPDIFDEARNAARGLGEYATGFFQPTLRLGVTGLSRAGKTVFITALVHNLIRGGRLPVFDAMAQGRIAAARLEPQPDADIPRFDYENHLAALVARREWPQSTRRVSQLRIVIEYQPFGSRRERTLTLDIVDYPGEWLLDLPLLSMSYADWSSATLALSRQEPRAALAAAWHAHLQTLQPNAKADEQDALTAARLFTEYLKACRDERFAMSLLPPGRFLLPGELEGSPALTFAPLEQQEGDAGSRSLWALMEDRFEAYKRLVVRPFFREHFSRLDRQIVLVDALAALNAGPTALRDLEFSLTSILECFRVGQGGWFSGILWPKIDRIMFAATKADHLHHLNHDRLERILARLADRAINRAQFSGATVDVVAMAAVRATREALITHDGEQLPAIIGVPAAGEIIGGEPADGLAETAVFPGDLPDDPAKLFDETGAGFRGLTFDGAHDADFRFLRFRPPLLASSDESRVALPHIRLDRALQFLLGDRLA